MLTQSSAAQRAASRVGSPTPLMHRLVHLITGVTVALVAGCARTPTDSAPDGNQGWNGSGTGYKYTMTKGTHVETFTGTETWCAYPNSLNQYVRVRIGTPDNLAFQLSLPPDAQVSLATYSVVSPFDLTRRDQWLVFNSHVEVENDPWHVQSGTLTLSVATRTHISGAFSLTYSPNLFGTSLLFAGNFDASCP